MIITGTVSDFIPVSPLENDEYLISYPYEGIHEGEYLKDENGDYIINDEGYLELNDNYKGNGKLTGDIYWHQTMYPWKPDLDYLTWAVGRQLNDDIDNKIVNEFLWKGNHVWLPIENQNNYSSAYNLAINTNGKNLPITFKFTKNDVPVYYEIKTVEEMTDLYLAMTNHINNTLKWGWNKKEKVDWSWYDVK